MNELVVALTTGGGATAITSAVAGVFGWRLRSANYAQIASEITRQVAQDVRKENADLKKEIHDLDEKVDHLRDRVITLASLILRAMPVLEAAGTDTTEYRDAVRSAAS